MGKTIKQIAEELGVSKQAVHQKRKSKSLSTALQPFTETVDGIVYISVDGEKLIKQAFQENDRQAVDDNEPTTNRQQNDMFTVLKTTINVLEKQLEIKDSQLKEKDNQIESLTAIIKTQSESINADRHNQLAETIIEGKKAIPESVNDREYQEKQSLFSMIFSKRKKQP